MRFSKSDEGDANFNVCSLWEPQYVTFSSIFLLFFFFIISALQLARASGILSFDSFSYYDWFRLQPEIYKRCHGHSPEERYKCDNCSWGNVSFQ